ncbi:MAG: DUF1800 domain-containing protein [bacterium]|nr:DUF1800 domain-containing protein [bacterium]
MNINNDFHLLSKATLGPTLEDLNEIGSMGRGSWLERQLHPGGIDNGEAEGWLNRYPSLRMSATELMQRYPRPRPGEEPVPGYERWRPFAELSGAMMILARYSQTQLLEVMTNFWFNHFNVYGPEGLNFYALTPYVMRTIRENALGAFPDILKAVAQTPAMMIYLDNYLSSRDITLRNGETRGLNENYARELLELHTLGVEAGYTQQDVIETAKILTGWSITNPRDNHLEFRFYDQYHASGGKTVLGRTFYQSGMQEGLDLLDYLSQRPETAALVARKLVAHFVSDTPPATMVEKVKAVYLETGGDIPSMLRAVFLDSEFYNPAYFRQKVKSPFRYLASAMRALAVEVRAPLPLLRPFELLGQPLFRAHPPTGYSDREERVMSTGVFLNTGQLMRGLAFNRLGGVSFNALGLVRRNLSGEDLADALMERILVVTGNDTASTIRKAAKSREFGLENLVSLVLATPEFCLF